MDTKAMMLKHLIEFARKGRGEELKEKYAPPQQANPASSSISLESPDEEPPLDDAALQKLLCG